MRKDLVSVIMPAHNSAAFIEEAIRSVRNQTYPHWELFVVDDCSTDNTCDLVKKQMQDDARIRLLFTPASTGMPCTPRNCGIEQARGRFIAFLDSDDAWVPTKLEEQLPLFDDASTAIVYGSYEKITENGERAGRFYHAPLQTTYKQLLRGNVIGNLTGMYDTQKTGKKFFQIIHHEDYVLWLSILKQGFIARSTGTVLGLYRVRSQSVSSRKFLVLPWQWYIYVHIEKFNVFKASYYYFCYAIKAFRKSLI